jgi:hypothetical protein
LSLLKFKIRFNVSLSLKYSLTFLTKIKNMKSVFFTLLVAFSSFSATAQTADEIINRHIEAIGGKDVLSKITSIYVEGSMSLMGTEAPNRTYILNGKGFKNEIDMMGSTIIQCMTDKGGWMVNPMAGGGIEDMPEKQAKSASASYTIGGIFLNYVDKGIAVELIGKKKVGDVEAFQLKVTPKEGMVSTYYIDPKTYYILKMEAKGEMMGQELEVTTTYSNYKKAENGYVMAHTTEMDMGQMAITNTVKKVEVNKTMDETTFSKPK